MKCGDIKKNGDTFWCHRCRECNRFSEEYDAFGQWYNGKISLKKYRKVVKDIVRRYEQKV